MKVHSLLFVVALFSTVGQAASLAQFDCTVDLNAALNTNYKAEFYGDNSAGKIEIINQTFNIDQVTANLRVLLINQRLLIQLSQPSRTDLWLSSEGQVLNSKDDLLLIFGGKLLAQDLDGLSSVRCIRR